MTGWMFWAFICLAVGQLTHSLPANDQGLRLRTVIGRAEMLERSSPSFSQKLRSIKNNNEDNDERNFLHDFNRRSHTEDYEQEVFELTNEARQEGRYCGSIWYPATEELEWNENLAKAAERHAESMRDYNYFSHTGIDGSTFVDREVKAGYSKKCAAGENIAGNQTPKKTVDAWLKSPGHCANIMNKDFKAIGVGYAEGGPYGGYWVQNFGYC